jgi:hypothetical protein
VSDIITKKLNKSEVPKYISRFASEHIVSDHCSRFIELVDIEVMSLHEGNFARFKVKPSEFFEWQKRWLLS